MNAKGLTAIRWPVIDVARGIALVAMAIYHFTWDLSFFRYIHPQTALQPGWAWFAKAIAASFLCLAGVSFALQARSGFNGTAYLKRLAMISLAAIAVTVTTWFAMPHAPVLFGILHCIAAASLLILPFLRLPPLFALAAGALFFILPPLLQSPAFDGAAFAWLGLNVTPYAAVDHVPVLPWAGWTFLGFGLMRLLLTLAMASAWRDRLARWRINTSATRALALAGRHSLAVYLLHQPIFIAVLWLFAPDARAQDIRTGCEQSCVARGDAVNACAASCACMIRELQARPVWNNILANRITADDQRSIDAIGAQCRRSP
ncbi:MAG: DUF1624 domain-containing protein [Beijerinckiaceae bacterium]